MPQKYSVQVRCSPENLLLFRVATHTRFRVEQFHLGPTSFYLAYGGNIPQTPHYELEIEFPLKPELEKFGLFAWKSRFDERLFINWPWHIPDIRSALDVIKVWAVGSAAKISRGVDMNAALISCDYEIAGFCTLMQRAHGVSCERGPVLVLR